MTMLHIEVDEAVAEAMRKKAESEGKTLDHWLLEIAGRQLSIHNNREWVRRFLKSTERLKGNSGGWKFNRDELYDE